MSLSKSNNLLKTLSELWSKLVGLWRVTKQGKHELVSNMDGEKLYEVNKLNEKEIDISELRVLILSSVSIEAITSWLERAWVHPDNIDWLFWYGAWEDGIELLKKENYDLLLSPQNLSRWSGSQVFHELAKRHMEQWWEHIYPTCVATTGAMLSDFSENDPYMWYKDVAASKTSSTTFSSINDPENPIYKALAKNGCVIKLDS